MTHLLSHPLHGLAKQLLGATSLQQAVQLGAVAANALRLPLQQAWMHSPAANSCVASSTHSYHGSRDDDNDSKKNSKAVGGRRTARLRSNSDKKASEAVLKNSSGSQTTEQLRALQEAIEAATEAVQNGQQAREAAQLPDFVARHAMRDPLGMLMTSQGVPLGISLKVNPETLLRRHQEFAREAESDKHDWQELLNSDTSSSRSESSEDHATAVPSTDAQLLRAKLVKATKSLMKASKVAKQSTDAVAASASTTEGLSSSSTAEQQLQQDEASVGQQVKHQLEQLFASGDSDSYGTTRQSPAEIAQQIADSNRFASGNGDDSDDNNEGESDDDEPLSLSSTEQRYTDQAAVTAELKEMDEIYEILAKVPWLDDEDVEERELRGVVAVGLLGTLEEVGWNLREKLLSLWAGERDLDVLTAGVGDKEAAALTAILYHTEQLERDFSKPPAAGVAAALAAAGGSPQAVGGSRAAEAKAVLEAAEKRSTEDK